MPNMHVTDTPLLNQHRINMKNVYVKFQHGWLDFFKKGEKSAKYPYIKNNLCAHTSCLMMHTTVTILLKGKGIIIRKANVNIEY